jgi:hypothetical protein
MDPQLLARIQAMLGGQGQQMPTTPFSQPPGTTLNSMGAPNSMPASSSGQINPPQPGNPQGGATPSPAGPNWKGAMQGVGTLANALNPKPAQISPMLVPNMQPHQMNPQAMQLLMQQSQQRPGSPGGGGPFGDTQGYSYG